MESPEKNGESSLEKAGAWLGRYDKKMEQILSSKKTDRAAVFETLWETCIMDRIAPLDTEERDARIVLQKVAWPGDREDPELYWRILCSAMAAEEASKRGQSEIAGSHGYVTGAFQGMMRVLYSPKGKELFLEVYDKKTRKDPNIIILEAVIGRAKKELEKRGVRPDKKLVPYGAKGRWHGIEVTVRYTDDGLIWFEADTEIDHARLYKFTHGQGVPPGQINPEDFKPASEFR